MARKRIVDITADTTLSKNLSGSIITLNNAGGIAITLPTASRGLEYDFVVKTTVTSADKYEISASGGASVRGAVTSGINDTAVRIQASTDADKISMDGTAGGAIGTNINMVCNNDQKWQVTGRVVGLGDTTVFA